MVQLVYWGLEAYDHLPPARAARLALVEQSRFLMLQNWRATGHIHENFNGNDGDGNDVVRARTTGGEWRTVNAASALQSTPRFPVFCSPFDSFLRLLPLCFLTGFVGSVLPLGRADGVRRVD